MDYEVNHTIPYTTIITLTATLSLPKRLGYIISKFSEHVENEGPILGHFMPALFSWPSPDTFDYFDPISTFTKLSGST